MKDFDQIQEDYAFFVSHSNEAERSLAVLSKKIAPLLARSVLRVLDFGCGTGEFLYSLLEPAFAPQKSISLRLIEPSPSYRATATENFKKIPSVKIEVGETLDASVPERYDLVLSQHVLYYTKSLDDVFENFFRASHSETQILVTLCSPRNSLHVVLRDYCQRVGVPTPFRNSSDLELFLLNQQIERSGTEVESLLRFKDTEEHRRRILKFVLGPLAAPSASLPTDLLVPFVKGDFIEMPLVDVVFDVRARFARINGAERRKAKAG